MSTWPTDDLTTANLDADTDTVTGAGGGREEIYEAVQKIQAILLTTPAFTDNNNNFTARQDITLAGESLKQIATGSAGVRIGMYADNGSPTTETGRVGFNDATDMRVQNFVSGGDVNLVTAGAGEAQYNGDEIDTLLRVGNVLQVVNTTYTTFSNGTTTIPADNTIPQNNEGDEYFTASITPSSTSNKLLIFVHIPVCAVSVSTSLAACALFQDSTANALSTSWLTGDDATGAAKAGSLLHFMTAGTTSSTTFKVRCGGTSGTFYINGGVAAARYNGTSEATLTIIEIAA